MLASGFCPPLSTNPATVAVSDATTLKAVVASAQPNDTIALANGTYDLATGIAITAPGVTLRSVSGDPAKVVLVGGAAATVAISASNVTIADLTIMNATTIALLVQGSATANTTGTKIYDVTFADAGGPAVRINALGGSVTGPFADTGTIACSRFRDTPTGPSHCGGAILGIDASAARDWIVRDNDFRDLVCQNSLARVILFRGGSRDTQVVRNRITGSNMNICLGIDPGTARTYNDPLPAACNGMTPQHWGGTICDNVIDAQVLPQLGGNDFDTGIGLWSVCDAWVTHNTIVSPPGNETYHDIEYRFAGTYVHLVNNLVEEAPAARDMGVTDPAFAGSNVTYAALADFNDAAQADFHLAADAPEQPGVALPAGNQCSTDADGRPRAAVPTVGAYER